MRTAPKRAATRSEVVSASVHRATSAPEPSSTKGTSLLPSVSTSARPSWSRRPRTVITLPRGADVRENGRSSLAVWCRYSGGAAAISTDSSHARSSGAAPSRAASTSSPSTIRSGVVNASTPQSAASAKPARDHRDPARDACPAILSAGARPSRRARCRSASAGDPARSSSRVRSTSARARRVAAPSSGSARPMVSRTTRRTSRRRRWSTMVQNHEADEQRRHARRRGGPRGVQNPRERGEPRRRRLRR